MKENKTKFSGLKWEKDKISKKEEKERGVLTFSWQQDGRSNVQKNLPEEAFDRKHPS